MADGAGIDLYRDVFNPVDDITVAVLFWCHAADIQPVIPLPERFFVVKGLSVGVPHAPRV